MTTLRDHLAEYLTMRRELGYQLDKLVAGRAILRLAHRSGQIDLHYRRRGHLGAAARRGRPHVVGPTPGRGANLRRLPAGDRGGRAGPTPRDAAGAHSPLADALHLLPAGPEHTAGCLARVFTRELVTATMRTVIGLLAATGMRIGEARRLRPADIDPSAGVLTVRASKNGTDRLVALHDSTTAALTAYRMLPARTATRPEAEGPLLVTTAGTGYHRPRSRRTSPRSSPLPGCNHRGRSRPRLHATRSRPKP